MQSKALARNTDPETSHAAAGSLDDVARMERAVLYFIKTAQDGATWDELHAISRIPKATISPRFKPLREKGLIEWHTDAKGNKVKRPGDSGRGQVVWYAATIRGA